MTALLDHARLYIGLGLAVLPLHFPYERDGRRECSCGRDDCSQPAKHPFGRLARAGVKDATKDLATVERWFAKSRLNIGIATGVVSGIFVLDMDPRHEGDEPLHRRRRKQAACQPAWDRTGIFGTAPGPVARIRMRGSLARYPASARRRHA